MICKNCNQIIDDDVKFCPNCGTAQNPVQQDQTAQDLTAQNAGSQDAAVQSADSQDAAPQNTYFQDAAPQNTYSQDSAAQDSYSQTAVPQENTQESQIPPVQQTPPPYYYEQAGNASQADNYNQSGSYNQSSNYDQSGSYNQSGNYNQYGNYNQSTNPYQGPVEMINTTPYLVFAILTTVCCCIPLGIPAIVFASKTSTAQQMGRMDEARDCAKKAKIFTIIAAAVGVLWYLFWFIMVLIGNVSYYYY